MTVSFGDPDAHLRFLGQIGCRCTDVGPGHARFELELRPGVMNRLQVPHGGIHATLLDSALGATGTFSGDPDNPHAAVTLSLTVNFLAAPATGAKRLIAEGHGTGGGRSIYFAEGVVRDDTGRELARGSGTFRRFAPR